MRFIIFIKNIRFKINLLRVIIRLSVSLYRAGSSYVHVLLLSALDWLVLGLVIRNIRIVDFVWSHTKVVMDYIQDTSKKPFKYCCGTAMRTSPDKEQKFVSLAYTFLVRTNKRLYINRLTFLFGIYSAKII
ncbi:hypothetical protein PAEPH01_0756 [Pancytospora epiphaga]|nr:hypothetical protein PAEPH01_0756 [Pancytospora epiphaga]